MEYENVDEITRQAACENVKKIVNAIKLIRIKYYPNFANISEQDQKVFQELNNNLEIIVSENNLHSLKNVLMSEVSAKYDKNNNLFGSYGAVDVEIQALLDGNMIQARECQAIFNQNLEQATEDEYGEMIQYRRGKFGELIRPKEVVQSKNEQWYTALKQFCREEYTSDREDVANLFSNISERGFAEEIVQESDTNELSVR